MKTPLGRWCNDKNQVCHLASLQHDLLKTDQSDFSGTGFPSGRYITSWDQLPSQRRPASMVPMMRKLRGAGFVWGCWWSDPKCCSEPVTGSGPTGRKWSTAMEIGRSLKISCEIPEVFFLNILWISKLFHNHTLAKCVPNLSWLWQNLPILHIY